MDKVISFTPTETGDFEFSCGMKMQKGSYTVVEKRRRVLGLLGRFWITSIFTVPLVILMIGMSTGGISHQVMRWADLSLSHNTDYASSRWSLYPKCLG